MAQTKYQRTPPSSLVKAAFKPSPLRKISVVAQGTESHPVPLPRGFGGNGPLNPAPSQTEAPGYSGTI